MHHSSNGKLMRIYTDQAALHGDDELVDVILARARKAGVAGATVLQGRTGYAAGSVIHEHHALGIGDNAPMVIELVDSDENLRAFITLLEDLHGIGLVTLEKVEIVSLANT